MLTPAQIARLNHGLPDLADWGAAMLEPFAVRRLCRASVSWINLRWFLERGLDPHDRGQRRRIEAWLLQEFAFAVPSASDPEDAFAGDAQTFHADRYGSSGRAPHGGSGRVGTRGRFQVKGIGATPLVGRRADWMHAHGCLWMEEALREAILGEIACAEFPHGAVPVIAILDCGFNFRHDDGSVGERRALVVRPAMLRIAHLQRAPLFVPAQDRRRAQLADAARTRDAVQRYGRGDDASLPFPQLIARVVEQIAYGQVHRLFYGGYFSSNLTLRGELLDYGSMRAMPDWAGAQVDEDRDLFGNELVMLDDVVTSVTFQLGKHLPQPAQPSAAELKAICRPLLRRAFERECGRLWQVPGNAPQTARRIAARLRAYFERQQRIHVRYNLPFYPTRPWLFDALGETAGVAGAMPEHAVLRDIDAEIRALLPRDDTAPARRTAAWTTAARFLMPRELLVRERLQGVLFDSVVFHRREAAPEPTCVALAIDTLVALSRRDWPALPDDLCVEAQTACGGSAALQVRRHAGSPPLLWLEGVRDGEYVHLFGQPLPLAALQPYAREISAVRWHGLVPVDAAGLQDGCCLRTEAGLVQVPPSLLHYRCPDPARLFGAANEPAETCHA